MKSLIRRLGSWTITHHRWFALGALFSLFSLFALFPGNEAWLGYLGFLGFLGFLAPTNAQRTPESAA
jgi:hypothetical protein